MNGLYDFLGLVATLAFMAFFLWLAHKNNRL
jgi:hypothetical protein